jgi:hypothetical protein
VFVCEIEESDDECYGIFKGHGLERIDLHSFHTQFRLRLSAPSFAAARFGLRFVSLTLRSVLSLRSSIYLLNHVLVA